MKEEKEENVNVAVGALTLLTFVLAIMKSTNFIKCSWWVVLSPLYAPAVFAIVAVFAISLFLKLKSKAEKFFKKK